MLLPTEIGLLFLNSITFVTGFMGNASILVVNVREWMKSSRFTPADTITSLLGASNLTLQCILFTRNLCFIFWREFFQGRLFQWYIAIGWSLFSFSLWSSAWLCAYYCVKIVNWKRLYYIHLKLPRMAAWLLCCSMLVSLTISIPSVWDVHRVSMTNTSSNISSHTSNSNYKLESRCGCMFMIYFSVSLLAFTIISFSALMIVTSLCRHMKRMEASADGSRNASLDSHLGAVKTVISLLILYVVFFLSLSLMTLQVVEMGGWLHLAGIFLLHTFPALNSLILILGHPRLKNVMTKIITQATCIQREGI